MIRIAALQSKSRVDRLCGGEQRVDRSQHFWKPLSSMALPKQAKQGGFPGRLEESIACRETTTGRSVTDCCRIASYLLCRIGLSVTKGARSCLPSSCNAVSRRGRRRSAAKRSGSIAKMEDHCRFMSSGKRLQPFGANSSNFEAPASARR